MIDRNTAAPSAGALALFSTSTTVYGYGGNRQIFSPSFPR